ncbi:MAG: hypothetical protein ABI693_04955 [Bryobacteraceae bacterium]
MINLLKVMLLGALALVSPIMAIGQSETLVATDHSLTIPESMEGRRSPIWSGGSLIVPQGPMGEENAFRAYDGGGRMVFNATFTVPEADHTYVRGFSRGADGILAICGLSSLNDGSSAPFLATISSDGGSQRLVRTAPYTPNVVVVAPDGTFWTVGRELDARLSEKSGVNLEAGVLRHFDKSGKLLSAFVPRSTISDTTTLASGQSFLVASSDRVGWIRFTPVGQASYMEVTADSATSTYPIPFPAGSQVLLEVNGLALTDEGEVFAALLFVDATPPNVKKTSVIGAQDDSPATVRFLTVRR